MGEVEDALVVGVGVDGGHDSSFDAEVILKNFGYWCQAVGGARGVGDDVVVLRIVDFFVYAEDDGGVDFVFCWGGDDYFFGSGGEVFSGCFTGAEDSGGFDDEVYAKFLPR